MDELLQYVESIDKKLDMVPHKLDVNAETTNRALDIVKEFIIERRFIIFGGLAIDYSLRMKGSSIYDDDELPDYDFMSKNSVNDAYDLAERLTFNGFENVDVIRGLHIQTMRVRVNFEWVADVGFIPESVFDKIPTLNYRGMKIVHPNFQRIHMHLGFCFPYKNPPLEDIRSRWKKDIQRFNMFETHYKIPFVGGEIKTKELTVALSAPIATDSGGIVAITGFLCYSLLLNELYKLSELFNVPINIVAPKFSFEFSSCSEVCAEVPIFCEKLTFVSHSPNEVLKGAKQYRSLIEIIPERYVRNSAEVYSTELSLLSAKSIDITVLGETKTITLVSPQYLLLYFMTHAIFVDTDSAQHYMDFYRYTLEILDTAEDIFLKASETYGRDKVMELYLDSPFAPSIEVFGKQNTSEPAILRLITTSKKLGTTEPVSDICNESCMDSLPKNYYGNKPRPDEYKYRNKYYQLDGLCCGGDT